MGFNRRKEDEHRRAAENKAAQQRATDPQIMEDAERLVALWNERQKQQMPMLFRRSSAPPSRPVIGFSGCPARRAGPPTPAICARSIATTTRRSRVSFRYCHAARAGRTRRSAELVRLSRKSIADDMREEHQRRVLGGK